MTVDPLTYPLASHFIRVWDGSQCTRMIDLGFSEANVVFFEIPFCPISGVGAGILRDYSRKCFYKCFCATDGVIANLTDAQLRVVLQHEQQEIREAVSQATDVNKGSAFTTLEAQVHRHVPEFQELVDTHGEQTVSGCLSEVAPFVLVEHLDPEHESARTQLPQPRPGRQSNENE